MLSLANKFPKYGDSSNQLRRSKFVNILMSFLRVLQYGPGEPAVRQMNRLSLSNVRVKFKIAGNLQIVLR